MAKKQQLPILRLVKTQNSGFERYWIEDQDDRVWTGKRFDSMGKALYANINDAAKDAQKILKSHFESVEPQRLVVPLFVEVYSHDPASVAEIANYLSRSTRLQVDSHDYGNGPGSSLVLPWIEWHRITVVKEFPNE